jgi:1-acyl-sn-glycerol-3-phosphate acyltransferase
MNFRASSSSANPPQPERAGRVDGAFRPGGILRTAAAYLRLWCGLLACGGMFLGWSGIAFAISPLFAEAERRRIGRLWMQRLFCLCLRVLHGLKLVKIDNDALETLRHERALILAPNHPSMMDVVLVIARLSDVGCVMKAELWDNIFLGAGARMADFIRNDSPHNMIKLAVRDLRRGSQLLIFPEATRTVRAPVNELSGGFALIAKKANAPIQTILIETDSPYLRKGWSLFRLPPLPITFRLRLGRRFQPRDDVDALVAEVERYFVEELGERAGGVGGAAPDHQTQADGLQPSARRLA